MTSLDHRLDRTITIHARPDVVYGFFTDSARWAAWWGAGSTIDARPGGAVRIVYPNGIEAVGEVRELVPNERLVFTFGFASGAPIAPGGSLVTLTLEAVPAGTEVALVHTFADPALRDAFVQGWRHQLALFANAVADVAHADAAEHVDAWFRAWAETDAAARAALLQQHTCDDVRFADRFGATSGRDELAGHIAAAQHFMPGVTMQLAGAVRRTLALALADWTAADAQGAPRGAGTNVFEFDADGRIARVTGVWAG